MKNSLKLLFFLSVINVSAQHTITKCDTGFCQKFRLGKTKIDRPKVKNIASHSAIYQTNQRNFERHEIDSTTVGSIDLGQLNLLPTKREKRDFLINFTKKNSATYKILFDLFNELHLEDGFINKDSIRHQLEKINDKYYALNYLQKEYDDFINDQAEQRRNYVYGLRQNRQCITERIKYIIDRDYSFYRDPLLGKQWIKGVSIFHDNDIFNVFINNEDYNYTGGGRIEVKTDKFKIRFLLDLFPEFNKKILAHQGLFWGTEAFTPYIRHTNISDAARDSLYRMDRPFGSYQYFGRTKYRLHYEGLWRSKSTLRVGTIGGNVGQLIQSVIHRDQTPKSIKVIGWENQIAHGGRFAWNVDYEFDLMIFASKGERDLVKLLKGEIENEPYADPKNQSLGFNLYTTSAFHAGNYLSAFDFGLGISGLNFTGQNGDNNIILRRNRNCSFNWYFHLKYRYVWHNAMLEGFGLFKTFEDDEYDDEPISVYQLSGNQVNRNLLFGELGLHFRIHKSTLFYKLTFHSKEFKMDRNPYYGWGTVGFSFVL